MSFNFSFIKTRQRLMIKTIKVTTSIVFLAVIFLVFSDRMVTDVSGRWLYTSVENTPFNDVGIIPGTRPSGDYFTRRIETAAALYHAGKIKWLIVSGDNGHAAYNEPREMQKALMEKGIPENAIYCDYAGFTTLDTVLRARDVFGQNRYTFISQAFHNQRAVYLARENNIAAIGVNAADVPAGHLIWSTGIREYVARGRAILDIYFFHRQPHFGGPVIIPGVTALKGCAGTA